MSTLARAYIGLGSNLDDPWSQLDRAVAALAVTPGVVLQRVSCYYRTRPWGETDQPDFLNAVAAVDTTLEPEALLAQLVRIEHAAGRQRERRWGPRSLDLDLLVHGDEVRTGEALQLPHPRLHERAFVLVPLAELAPDLRLGTQGRVDELLARSDASSVRRVDDRSDLE